MIDATTPTSLIELRPLTKREMYRAGQIGLQRQIEAVSRDSKVRFPEKFPGELWRSHVLGAMAELAVCLYCGVEWDEGVNRFHVPDLWFNSIPIDVRWSMRNDLKVRPDDDYHEDLHIAGVWGLPPRLYLAGVIPAWAAMRDEWYHARGKPCYFVPHRDLLPFESLGEIP